MPYSLEPGEPVVEGLHRAIAGELASAALRLSSAKASNRDAAVHEARKSIKRARAALRLLRDTPEETGRVENRRLRDAGRRLSPFRDARAMIDTFDDLAARHTGRLARSTVAAVRRGLAAGKRRQTTGAAARRSLSAVASRLRAAARRTARLAPASAGTVPLAAALERTYRQGSAAMARAARTGRPEDFHEWRKRLKDHWFQLQLLAGLEPDGAKGREKDLKQLQTLLGDLLNLFVLGATLRAQPERFGTPAGMEVCLHLIEADAGELEGRALELGATVYAEKPGRFRRRMERLPVRTAPSRSRLGNGGGSGNNSVEAAGVTDAAAGTEPRL